MHNVQSPSRTRSFVGNAYTNIRMKYLLFLDYGIFGFKVSINNSRSSTLIHTHGFCARPFEYWRMSTVHTALRVTKGEVNVTHEPERGLFCFVARTGILFVPKTHNWNLLRWTAGERESERINNGCRMCVRTMHVARIVCSYHYSNSSIEWSGAKQDKRAQEIVPLKIRTTTADKIIIGPDRTIEKKLRKFITSTHTERQAIYILGTI